MERKRTHDGSGGIAVHTGRGQGVEMDAGAVRARQQPSGLCRCFQHLAERADTGRVCAIRFGVLQPLQAAGQGTDKMAKRGAKKGGCGKMENNEPQGLTEANRRTALELIAQAQRREKAVKGSGGKKDGKQKLSLVCLENVEEEEVSWLYCPYVPRGKLTLCAAYPGTGKTYLLCYMAACVSTGRSFFNLIPFGNEPEKVIYLTAEDGIGDTIKKRLRICGADMKNIYTVTENKSQLLFNSPEIEEYMKDAKPALMIFDPFQAYIGSDVDMNAPNKTREQMGHIVELAQKYDVAVVIICHFNKNGKGDAITRILGSTDIMGSCRSYIALGNVPGEDDTKFMSHEKSSLEKKGKTILFEIDPDRGGIVYMGENLLSMDDYTAIRNKRRAKAAPAIEGAKEFLVNNMPEGRRLAQELMNLAKANRISDASLQRAKQELGIISQKTNSFPSRAIWVLPGHEEREPETKQEELSL
ncbi:AAA family ATPase [Hominisplanchenecus murintestinalis]|uniref:AAA family ATPase n=1 Tax=Hominisplanchenecus murintestinalis TaxID=2941517 RepID=A0AC61QV41_9FIRM|nr:AAA family ATPase [Hominisplanchenecus murintestinalis]